MLKSNNKRPLVKMVSTFKTFLIYTKIKFVMETKLFVPLTKANK